MGEIVSFGKRVNKKSFMKNNLNINNGKDIYEKNFREIKVLTNKTCATYKVEKKITDAELKVIFYELSTMLDKINPSYVGVIKNYMNYIVNYCAAQKQPVTKLKYIENLNLLSHYLDTLCKYQLDESVIAEEQEKLSNLMQRR